MNLLIVDTETTGLDPEDSQLIEVAGAVYHLESGEIVWSHASVIPWDGENEAHEINHLSESMKETPREMLNLGMEHPLTILHRAASAADVTAIMAHNAKFDREFLAFHGGAHLAGGWPWICTVRDIVFPRTKAGRSLNHIAVDHGVNPCGPQRHRALWDVMLVAELIGMVDNLADQIAEALRPKAIFIAEVSFERRDIAKNAGFVWNNLVAKKWAKEMPEDTPLDPTKDRPFYVRRQAVIR